MAEQNEDAGDVNGKPGPGRPLHARPVVLEYSRPIAGENLVTLSKMPGMEAELASMKLRSNGVPAFIADQNIALANPYVFPYVTLQVQASDLERAKSILNEPAPVEADGEYADEPWRCPRCHRKTVQLMPMTQKWRTVFYFFLFLIVLPFGVEFFGPMLPDPIYFTVRSMGFLYVLALFVSACSLLLRKRHKRCTTCSHEWS